MPFTIKFFGHDIKSLEKQGHTDSVDRLSYFYGVLILIIFASIVLGKQMVGEPIHCWVPAEFKDSWGKYVDAYCFTSNTYFVPQNISISGVKGKIGYGDKKISYYQWVPFIFLLLASFFYLPHSIWKCFSGLSGLNVDSILQMAAETACVDREQRTKNIQIIGRTLSNSLRVRWELGQRQRPTCSSFLGGLDRFRGAGNQLCLAYIFMKILNCVNAIGQLFFIDAFLDADHWFLGGRILLDFMKGNDFVESERFPRVTICEFIVRQPLPGNAQPQHVQCVLPINMWNEKLFLLLWCWLILVAVCSCWNLLVWLYNCFRSTSKLRLVEKYLKVGLPRENYELDTVGDRHLFDKFMTQVLKSDGVLLFRFISGHAGDLLATEVIVLMFEDFVKSRKKSSVSTNKSRVQNGCLIRNKPMENGEYPITNMGMGDCRERYSYGQPVA